MLESEFATHLSHQLALQGWDVYPEVQIRNRGRRADLIAIKQACVWIIETKLTLNLTLLEQIVYWQDQGATLCSIALPYVKRRTAGKKYWCSPVTDFICRQKGIGILFLKEGEIFEPIRPKLQRYNYQRSQLIKKKLDTRMKQYVPGSSGMMGYSSHRTRVLEDSLSFLRQKYFCSLTDLAKSVATQYHSTAKAKKYILSCLSACDSVVISQKGYEYYITISPSQLEKHENLLS